MRSPANQGRGAVLPEVFFYSSRPRKELRQGDYVQEEETMIIQIDDDRRIIGTKHCWEIQKKVNRKGEPFWMGRKFFSTFVGALESVVQEEIRLHPANDLAEAIEAVSEITQRFSDLIPANYRPE